MPTPTRKGIFLVLLAMCLVVAVAVIPDIIADKMKEWSTEIFADGYEPYYFVVLILGSVILLFLTTDIARYLRPGATPTKSDRFNIPPGAATRKQIDLAKTAISQAEPEQALRHLSELKVPALDTEIATLSSRYAEYRRSSRQGINSRDEDNRTYNRISKDILDLIKTLESELATGSENYQTIKDYLKKRYTNRRDHKLAKRQPVNLRRLVNTEVLPEDNKPAFIEYKSDEVSGALLQTFRDAKGRLLIVGAPGAGKTTLMLQLVLELLEAEPDHLPVVLNLATWSKEYITLEAWLKKILAAELGVSEKYAAEIIQQNRLIPLFDGFDEIREEDRLSCLEAINRYGEDTQRQYAISSRKHEFQEVNKAVVVHLPIEVCPLELEQMKVELQRLWEKPDKPERGAKLLLDAIENNTLLQEAVQTPFYFNTLQTLFNGGKTLSELDLTANSVDELKRHITERFVNYELEAAQVNYPKEKAEHWLSFLASRMTERNMVVFELRDLQYDWWKWNTWQISLAGLVYGIAQFLFYGLTVGIFIGLIGGPWAGFIGGIDAKSVFGPYNGPWVGALLGLSITVLIGLTAGLFYGKITGPFSDLLLKIYSEESSLWSIKGLSEIIITIIVLGPFITLFFGLISGLISGSIAWLACILFLGLIVWKGKFWESIQDDILQIITPYQRFIISAKNLHFSILQHKFLCLQLHRQSLLPLDLVTFLNELSLRHILEFDGNPETGKGGGAWRFRHRILQDYFTARYFADNASKGTLKELVDAHLYDDTWQEIFLLVARKEPIADELLSLMLKKNRELLRELALNNLLAISAKALLPTNTNYTPEFRKAVFIFRALEIADDLVGGNNRVLDRALNLALSHALLLALGLDLDGALDHTPIRILLRDLDLNLDLLDALEHDLNRALERNIDLEMVNKKITQNINYLTGNLLILQCLSAAAYFSTSTREYVLRMMLAPLTEEEKAAMGVKEE